MMCHLHVLVCPQSFKEKIRNKHIKKKGIIVAVFASRVADRGFEPQSDQSKDYKIDICCFSVKYAAPKIKKNR